MTDRTTWEHAGRCQCPVCRQLDRQFPREGYQLALPGTGARTGAIPTQGALL